MEKVHGHFEKTIYHLLFPELAIKIILTRSMIHLARPTVSPVVNIVFAWNLFFFEKWGWTEGLTTTRTKTMITTSPDCGSAEWINFFFISLFVRCTLQECCSIFKGLSRIFRTPYWTIISYFQKWTDIREEFSSAESLYTFRKFVFCQYFAGFFYWFSKFGFLYLRK